MNVVFIGAGNIATSLAFALQRQGHRIVQIFSRTTTSAQQLADKLGGNIMATNRMDEVHTDADLYVLAVRDGVLADVAKQLADVFTARNETSGIQRLFVHVACTQSVEVLEPLRRFGLTGVLYPLQTFVRSKVVDLSHTTFFVEGSDEKAERRIHELSLSFSPIVYAADYEQRQYLHFAGNMAANFSNCLYAIAKEALDEAHLPFDVLFPIVDETARKIHTMTPREAQSGPAARGDEVTIQKHLALIDRLSTPTAVDTHSPVSLKDMYRFFTHNIQTVAKN